MDMHEALQRRRGEGRFRSLRSMIAETRRIKQGYEVTSMTEPGSG